MVSVHRAVAAVLLALAFQGARASNISDAQSLVPLWQANAPKCQGFPSSDSCQDGDMTLFNGLLCASGEQIGCQGVKAAQDASGRWHRSPRLAADPSSRPTNSFSWDMALGVQLYVVTTGDKAALGRWLSWVESNRPCLVQSPNIGGQTYCLVRGWPRWCTDDTEKGCTAKPQNLATLVRTVDTLGIPLPSPAEDQLPGGIAGAVLKKLQDESREANATLSLKGLLESARGLHPTVLLLDAAVNREGYPRNLAGTEILLARRLGLSSREVALAALILGEKEPENAFFQYLVEGPTERVAGLLLKVAPQTAAQIPAKKDDWTWQRAQSAEAWKEANLWDFVFMARLLGAK